MGSMSIWHWLIVLIVVLLLFGSGKISTLMGDLAKGIKVFKKNMAEEEPVSSLQQENKSLSDSSKKQLDSSVTFNEIKEHAPVASSRDHQS